MRYAGATGPLTVRADRGFYSHAIVAACRDKSVRFSITVRQHQSVRNIIEAIPETDWTPIPYWMEGAADVAETEYTPFGSEPDAVPVRLIVRRVKPTPGSQLALFTSYSYHAFITDRDGDTLDLEADHRRHAEIENAIRDPASSAGQALKYGVGLIISLRDAFPPTVPGWPYRACPVLDTGSWPTTWHVGPHVSVSARPWLPPRPCGDASSPWPDASPARRGVSPCTSPRAGPGETSSAPPWSDCAPCHSLPDGVRPVRRTTQPAWRICAKSVPECLLLQADCRSPPPPAPGRQKSPSCRWLTPHPTKSIGIKIL